MVDIASVTVSSGNPPPHQGTSWGAIVGVQILLLLLGGMVLDGGLIGAILLVATVVSWICGAFFALRGRTKQVPRVLVWSWVTSIILATIVYRVGDVDAMRRASMHRALIGNNERQLLIGCIAYRNEDPQKTWPIDMHSLIVWSKGDLNDKLLKVRWHADLEHPILYVRPSVTAPGQQPVILSDPACDRKGKVVVAYADGYTGVIADAEQAKAVWTEAKRLAVMPKALTEGISKSDWTVGLEKP